MRDIAVISVGRSDYSIIKPLLHEIQSHADLELSLIVSGMHLSPEFGFTVSEIEKDGWPIREKVEHLVASDTPSGVAKSIGLGVVCFADLFSRYKPSILVVMGDRFEMFCAAIAAQPFNIPIAHIHGGETTIGAIDEAFRHSMTKMSHVHFVATQSYRRRVIQMGENSDYVYHTGSPALDNLLNRKKISFEELQEKIGIVLKSNPYIVTYHPETVNFQHNEANLKNIFSFFSSSIEPVIFTASNADSQGRLMNELIQKKCLETENFFFRQNLGVELYFALLEHSIAMIGNSSSGISEAASFNLPVINLGKRQIGRVHGENVIHAECTVNDIQRAMNIINTKEFRKKISKIDNPYFKGGSSKKICKILASLKITPDLVQKTFFDM